MIKVVNKGYTLTVTSWENDGDNYRTKSTVFQDKDEAIKVAKMCQELFVGGSNGGGGIGNNDERDGPEETILEYLEENPDFFNNQSEIEDDMLIDKIMDINYNVMGGSEYYYSRVFESATLTYSPEDIYLEEISF